MKILLTTLIICVSLPIEAQILPFVEAGKVWNYASNTGGFSEFLQGDTIVNGKHCLKWYVTNGGFADNGGKAVLYGVMYEEDGKVYAIKNGTDNPWMLYDFNWSVGDGIGIDYGYGEAVILSVQKNVYEGIERRVYEAGFSPDIPERVEGIWIEGIGSVWGMTTLIVNPGNSVYLINCTRNGKILYQSLEVPNTKIDAVHHTPHRPSSLFDLQGRPLSTPPSRGLYIQNGKKVIK